jgi:hypothetical protein
MLPDRKDHRNGKPSRNGRVKRNLKPRRPDPTSSAWPDGRDEDEDDVPAAKGHRTKAQPKAGANGTAAMKGDGKRKCRVSPEDWEDDDDDAEDDWDDHDEDDEEEDRFPDDDTNIDDGFVGGAADEAEEEAHEANFQRHHRSRLPQRAETLDRDREPYTLPALAPEDDPDTSEPPEPEPPRKKRKSKGQPHTDPLIKAHAIKSGARINPPCRRDDHARCDANEHWIKEWLRQVRTSHPRDRLLDVASWIIDRTRATPKSHGWPRERAPFRRLDAQRVHWILWRSEQVAHDTLIQQRTVQRLLLELVRVGLVECRDEPSPPPPPVGQEKKKHWYGPQTKLVRVRYELFSQVQKGGEA